MKNSSSLNSNNSVPSFKFNTKSYENRPKENMTFSRFKEFISPYS